MYFFKTMCKCEWWHCSTPSCFLLHIYERKSLSKHYHLHFSEIKIRTICGTSKGKPLKAQCTLLCNNERRQMLEMRNRTMHVLNNPAQWCPNYWVLHSCSGLAWLEWSKCFRNLQSRRRTTIQEFCHNTTHPYNPSFSGRYKWQFIFSLTASYFYYRFS